MIRFLTGNGRWLGLAACGMLLASQGASGALPGSQADADLIYKIGKFVRWPEGSFAASGGSLKLCIVGQDDFATDVERLAGQKLQGQIISIQRYASLGPPVLNCHIAFISGSERGDLAAFLNAALQAPVLTISDMDGFAAQGGMVGFAAAAGAFTIEVNSGASKRAGLEIGAPLLQRATLVADERPGAKP